MGKRTVNRRAVLEQMMALAAGAANDVVKLAYLTQEQTQEIDTLDLGCLTEFKRNSSGAVEVKLTDRAAVLEKLLEQLKDEENRGAAAFLEALDRPQAPEGMCSRRGGCAFPKSRSGCFGGGIGALRTRERMPSSVMGRCAAGRPCAWVSPLSCGA